MASENACAFQSREKYYLNIYIILLYNITKLSLKPEIVFN